MRRPFPFRRVCLFVPPQSSITNVFDPASSDVPPQSSYKRHPSKPRTPETHSRDTAKCDTIIIIYIEGTQNQGSRCTSSALFHLPFFLSIHFLSPSLSLSFTFLGLVHAPHTSLWRFLCGVIIPLRTYPFATRCASSPLRRPRPVAARCLGPQSEGRYVACRRACTTTEE